MNLLPKDLRPRKQALRFQNRLTSLLRGPRWIRPMIPVLVMLLGMALWQGPALWRHRQGATDLRKELEQLRRLSAELKTQQQDLHAKRAQLLAKRAELEARREALMSTRQPPVPVSSVLVQLAKTIPEEVWITKLSFAGESLKLVGASQDTQAVADLMARLEGSKRFRDTTFVYTQRATQGAASVFTFEISTIPVLREGHDS